MSEIRVRRLDENYDPCAGQGQADFLTDLDAVVQIIRTRLMLFKGEWWENTNAGLPLWQSILGSGKGNDRKAMDGLIQQRIMGTPFVVGTENLISSYNASTRSYNFTITVNTKFGQAIVSNQ